MTTKGSSGQLIVRPLSANYRKPRQKIYCGLISENSGNCMTQIFLPKLVVGGDMKFEVEYANNSRECTRGNVLYIL